MQFIGVVHGGRGSTVVRWTRRRAAPAYAPTPDLIGVVLFAFHCKQVHAMEIVYSRSDRRLFGSGRRFIGNARAPHNSLRSTVFYCR